MSARVAGDDGLIDALRARRNKGKEPIEREAMQDRRLSMKARGILGYLVSKPDKWRTNAKAIADDCDEDGRDSIATGLKELEALGYLARKRRPGPGGRFVWCWIYSDDPDEVAEVLAEMFPDGAKPDARRRGRARTKTLGGEPLVKPKNGKTGDGDAQPQVEPINGFAVDGSPVDGSSVDGKPVDIESKDLDNPPSPPQSGGNEVSPEEEPGAAAAPSTGDRPRCGTHNRAGCRECGLSPRAQAREEREREAAAAEAAADRQRRCRLCDVDGNVLLSPGVVLTPKRGCDHEKPLQDVLAEVQAEEDAAERARVARAQGAATPATSEEGRAAAKALFQSKRSCAPRSGRRERSAVTVEASSTLDEVQGVAVG